MPEMLPSDAFETDTLTELERMRADLDEMRLGLEETEDALRSMLLLFDRDLPPGSLGRMLCEYARSLVEPQEPAPDLCPECEMPKPCACDRYRWT